jgi:hypothetical protein
MYVDSPPRRWILAGHRGFLGREVGLMAIVRLPMGRLRGVERLALRDRAATSSRIGSPLRLVQGRTAAPPFCAVCAAPVESGAVIRDGQVFCSVECILGGDHPA